MEKVFDQIQKAFLKEKNASNIGIEKIICGFLPEDTSISHVTWSYTRQLCTKQYSSHILVLKIRIRYV